jgi:serine O-acetyltransferase
MLNAIYFYRVSRWLYLHHIPFLPKLITLLIFLIYNSKVPYQAKIGKGTKLGYAGMGVVIHTNCIIGENCSIAQQVTIGGGNSKYQGVPTIGNNVRISKGAIVFGGITIGNNVTVGANAVVNKPVPDNAVVAGVPAKIIRIKDNI